MERIGDATILMLGERSHGTHVYYTWQTTIAKCIVEETEFRFIVVEGDRPDFELSANRTLQATLHWDMSALLYAVMALQVNPFYSGAGRGKPSLPAKSSKPPRLEVNVARAEWIGKDALVISILLRNAGDGELKIDPHMLDARWELVAIQLTDEAGKRVRFKGDDIAVFVSLTPERSLSLWPGTLYGFETILTVPKPGRETFARVYVGYPELKPKTAVWTGEVWSAKVRAKPFVRAVPLLTVHLTPFIDRL